MDIQETTRSLPKISVITVVLNGKNFLERAIQSVLQQNYPNLEYIIIDGGSSDGTVDIIKKYSAHISYWQSEPDGGAAFAQNIGLQHASGDLIGFLFADDWYEADTLPAIATAWCKSPSADVVTCGAKIVLIHPHTGEQIVKKEFSSSEELTLSLQNIFFGHSLVGARFFAKTLFEKVGNFRPVDANGIHNFTNDHDLLLRMILQNAKNVIADHIGYVYFAHSNSFTIGRFAPDASYQKFMPTIKRIRQEHIFLSEYHLSSSMLTQEQRNLFETWHLDQITRLFICDIYTRQWRDALITFKKAWEKHGFKIIKSLLMVPSGIILNKARALIYNFNLKRSHNATTK